jgi:hypothetical protein
MDAEEALLVHEEVATAVDSTPPLVADDSADPRHRTYKPFVIYACIICFIMSAGPMISVLSVLPDTMVTWLNHGVSCNGAAARDDPDCKSATARYTLINGITGSIGCFITFLVRNISHSCTHARVAQQILVLTVGRCVLVLRVLPCSVPCRIRSVVVSRSSSVPR